MTLYFKFKFIMNHDAGERSLCPNGNPHDIPLSLLLQGRGSGRIIVIYFYPWVRLSRKWVPHLLKKKERINPPLIEGICSGGGWRGEK